jgi:hypothetical protein
MRLTGRQKDFQINVREVDERKDLSASTEHFARFGKAEKYASEGGSLENTIVDLGLNILNARLGGVNGTLPRYEGRFRRFEHSHGDVALADPRVVKLLTDCIFSEQRGGSADLLLRQSELRLCLCNSSFFRSNLALGIGYIGFCTQKLRLHLRSIHPGDDLARLNQISFPGEDFRNAAGNLRRDIHLYGFNPTVAESDANWEFNASAAKQIVGGSSAGRDYDKRDADGAIT